MNDIMRVTGAHEGEARGQGLVTLHDLTSPTTFIGICRSRPFPFGSLSRIQSTCMVACLFLHDLCEGVCCTKGMLHPMYSRSTNSSSFYTPYVGNIFFWKIVSSELV